MNTSDNELSSSMKAKYDRIGFVGLTSVLWLPSPVFNVKASRGCTIIAGGLMAINLSLDIWHMSVETSDSDSAFARFSRATIASLVINSYSILDAFIRAVKGASPLTWLAEKASIVAGLKDHYLPSKIIRLHASGFFILNLLALVFRFADMKAPSIGCLAFALFSSWVYGFVGVCPMQVGYGFLLLNVCIRLRDDERCIILEAKQERCEFSPFGPFVSVCGPDAITGSSNSSMGSDDEITLPHSTSEPGRVDSVRDPHSNSETGRVNSVRMPRSTGEPDRVNSVRTGFSGASLAWVNSF